MFESLSPKLEMCEQTFEGNVAAFERHHRDWFIKDSTLICHAFVGEKRQPYAFHGYPTDSSQFDPANDPLDDNCCFHDIQPPLIKAPTRDSSPPMRLFGDDSGSDVEFIGQAPPSLGKIHPSLFMGLQGLESTPINPRLAYSTANMKIPGFNGFPRLEGGHINTSLLDYDSILTQGRANPEKKKDPKQVEKRSNKKGEEVLMLLRPATKGVAMIMERFTHPGNFKTTSAFSIDLLHDLHQEQVAMFNASA
ncbi:hypothetical protein BT96DRAFT_943647 [Gymnopus androsaceus JB14]|uniref:Uncharacterized protein n=1 Tax=Gymnopus androsaceus JB14 TaxID=1447944 RepID=A0A6A4H6J9_9AGAR|nr:hypothetical protein BT96DRAFT_943647 [Gymnopus androsaceus JB14]